MPTSEAGGETLHDAATASRQETALAPTPQAEAFAPQGGICCSSAALAAGASTAPARVTQHLVVRVIFDRVPMGSRRLEL